MPDYAAMTAQELDAEFRRLAAEYVSVMDARRAVLCEIRRRSNLAAAQVKVASLSPAEREALKAALE